MRYILRKCKNPECTTILSKYSTLLYCRNCSQKTTRINKEGNKICKHCKNIRKIVAKGSCKSCYNKHERKLITCKGCGYEKHLHAKGFCFNCYQKQPKQYKYIKNKNIEYLYCITPEKYEELTKKCVICGFDKIVDLHHIDSNHENSKEQNLIGLCPNHHKMIHTEKYTAEITAQIIELLKSNGITK